MELNTKICVPDTSVFSYHAGQSKTVAQWNVFQAYISLLLLQWEGGQKTPPNKQTNAPRAKKNNTFRLFPAEHVPNPWASAPTAIGQDRYN